MIEHFVYRTTCPHTGKFYIGVHSTDNHDDGYVGSGLWPRRYIKKHGRDVLVREIISVLPTRAQAENRERAIVSITIDDPLCMNFAPGGSGHTKESAKKWRADRKAKFGGSTKDKDPAVAKVAILLTGRTKETHDYIATAAIKTGLSKRGRRKETHDDVARMAIALTGRTKETHPGILIQSRKITGRTKETHAGVRAQADKIKGRSFPSVMITCSCGKTGRSRGMKKHINKCQVKELK